MKYIFLILFFIPIVSFGQANCDGAYFHRNSLLDRLPVPVYIQKSTDSLRKVMDSQLVAKKKEFQAKYKDVKTLKKKLKQEKLTADSEILKIKRKWLAKYYAEKMKNAQLEIYDKGKKYKYVFDADTGSYKITPTTCDETERMYKLVMEAK